MIKAKAWKDDNWLLKLNRLSEGTNQYPSIDDERLEHLGIKAKPASPKPLRPDNVFKFPKLWQDYFNIYIEYPQEIKETSHPNITGYDSPHYMFEEALKDFHEQISKRGYTKEEGKLTAEERSENAGLESAARAFYTNTMRCAIDLFKRIAKDSIEAYRVACENAFNNQNEEYRDYHSKTSHIEVSPTDREAYFDYYYDGLDEKLENLYRDLANKEIKTISRNDQAVNDSPSKGTTFEVRHVKEGYIVYINLKSDLLMNKSKEIFYSYNDRRKYRTRLGAAEANITKNDLKKLEVEYGCSSFISKMSALKGGRTNGNKTETDFCGKEQVQTFFEKGLYEKFLKFGWAKPLPETSYNQLISEPETTVSEFPASESSPHLIALNVADYTDGLFKDELGGTLDIDDSNNLILRCKTGEVLSVQDAQARFYPILKSDVLYVTDSPSERYNRPDCRGSISIQVKYLDKNSNVIIGDMEVSRELLRKFKRDLEDGITKNSPLVQYIIQLLIYKGYIIVVDSWNRYYCNASQPIVQETDFKKAEKTKKKSEDDEYKEYQATFSKGNLKFTLRVPDIDIVEREDKEMKRLGLKNEIKPEIRAMLVK